MERISFLDPELGIRNGHREDYMRKYDNPDCYKREESNPPPLRDIDYMEL